jgi:hypothetical protein
MNPRDVQQLVQGRITQAVERLTDAKALRKAGRSRRSIVNRSYYSMFYCVSALLQTISDMLAGQDFRRMVPFKQSSVCETKDQRDSFHSKDHRL